MSTKKSLYITLLTLAVIVAVALAVFYSLIRKAYFRPNSNAHPQPVYSLPEAPGKPVDLPKDDQPANPLPVEDETKQKRICSAAGGTWQEFPNACADTCGDQLWCNQVLTEGCECGQTKCWNGFKCESE